MNKKLATIIKNLDKYRIRNKLILTKEQKEFLRKCRKGNEVVSWNTIAMLWEEIGWGKISPETLRKNYIKLLKNRI